MGSMLGDWPSFDPMNFSQLRPTDPSSPSRMTPVTYCPTHDRCLPPPNQDNFHIALNLFNLFCKQYSSIIDLLETKCPVITSEARNILLRNMYKRTEEKLRSKRPASENLTSDQGIKHPRTSTAESSF